MQHNYHPHDFQEPTSTQYYCCLGKCEFEIIATHIIRVSQIEGSWVPVKDFPQTMLSSPAELSYRLKQMVHCGHLEETKDGYLLPQETLEIIAKEFPIRK